MAGKLTKTRLDRMEPGATAWDSTLPGFGARARQESVSFIVKYRAGGRQRLYTIGKHGGPWTVEQARREAKRILGRAMDGDDPAAEKAEARQVTRLRDLAAAFIEDHGPRIKARTAAEYQRIIDSLIVPELGGLYVEKVERRDIARFHHKLRDRPYQANRALATLSKLFSWAEAQGYRADNTNPCSKVKKYPEEGRERFLSADELARLGRVLRDAEGEACGHSGLLRAGHRSDNETTTYSEVTGVTQVNSLRNQKNRCDPTADCQGHTGHTKVSASAIRAIRLLIFTGCRRGEILKLRWEDVDLERGLLLLPDSKTGRKAVHLNAPAAETLANAPREAGNPYVCPGNKAGQPLTNIQKPWTEIRRRAGLDDVRVHDLRHSFASVAAAQGASLPVIGALLGHREQATTQKYAHLADDPVKAAADRAGQGLAAALDGDDGPDGATVVPIHGKG